MPRKKKGFVLTKKNAKEKDGEVVLDLNKSDKLLSVNDVEKLISKNSPSKLDKNPSPELDNNLPSELDNNLPSDLNENLPSKLNNNSSPKLDNNSSPKLDDNSSKLDKNPSPELDNNLPSELDNNLPSDLNENLPSKLNNNSSPKLDDNSSELNENSSSELNSNKSPNLNSKSLAEINKNNLSIESSTILSSELDNSINNFQLAIINNTELNDDTGSNYVGLIKSFVLNTTQKIKELEERILYLESNTRKSICNLVEGDKLVKLHPNQNHLISSKLLKDILAKEKEKLDAKYFFKWIFTSVCKVQDVYRTSRSGKSYKKEYGKYAKFSDELKSNLLEAAKFYLKDSKLNYDQALKDTLTEKLSNLNSLFRDLIAGKSYSQHLVTEIHKLTTNDVISLKDFEEYKNDVTKFRILDEIIDCKANNSILNETVSDLNDDINNDKLNDLNIDDDNNKMINFTKLNETDNNEQILNELTIESIDDKQNSNKRVIQTNKKRKKYESSEDSTESDTDSQSNSYSDTENHMDYLDSDDIPIYQQLNTKEKKAFIKIKKREHEKEMKKKEFEKKLMAKIKKLKSSK